ncbi:MAG: ATP-binding cassette domain-containing protein [Spirochaetales bacterium]|nr:ATP-binding cassette domain-containing protein [Spirochaetales bacterium]
MSKLSIDSLHFSYQLDPVLTGACISCNTGERIALSGENGSGKSTLFKIIAGQLNPPSAPLKIDDIYIPPSDRFKYLAWLPQDSFLPKGLRVKQAISLFSTKNQKQELFSDSRIQELLDRKIRNLSGGEKRYIETSMILSLNRNFYILDEPFTEVEPLYQKTLFDKISTVSLTAGFILIDHNSSAMAKIATSQLLLIHGQVYPIKERLE